MAREIELKYELENVEEYIAHLCKLGITLSSTLTQCDTIFFRRGKCFRDLEAGEPVVRIRQENGMAKTTAKKYIIGITEREEVECIIDDIVSFKKYLALLDFTPIVTVNKTRRKGSYRGTTITVDCVEGLGEYTEIEIVTDETSTTGLNLIKNVAKELGLNDMNLVSMPYDEMLFMKGENDD